MSDPRYPIGKFKFERPPDREQREKFIDDIAQTPAALRAAVQGLTPAQIETPYRDGGWTVRQVVHHVPESHMNAYIRFKLALTEHAPTIKPYMEDRWANLPDVHSTPVEVSLSLLDSLHERWVHLLRGLQLESHLQSPRARKHAAREKPGSVFVAWQTSRSPHHRVAEQDGMVGAAFRAPLSRRSRRAPFSKSAVLHEQR
jgi:hypothetical protein